MQKIIAWIVIGVSAIWALLNFIGTLETARGLFANRGATMKVLGSALTSQWLPVAVFLVGIIGLYCVQFGIPQWLKPRSFSDRSPRLVGRIEQVNFARLIRQEAAGETPILMLAVLMSIRNTGAPSGATGWPMDIHSAPLAADKVQPLVPDRDLEIAKGAQLHREDMLFEKVATPIPTGHTVFGWLTYFFPGVDASVIWGQDVNISISFIDALEKESTATFFTPGKAAPAKPKHFPGVNNPFRHVPPNE